MKNWKLFKNTQTAETCWQLYYVEDDGGKRYFDMAFSYPIAAGLRDALMDSDIRRYVSEFLSLPLNKMFQYRKDNMETFDKMLSLTQKYNKGADTIYERLIFEAMKEE